MGVDLKISSTTSHDRKVISLPEYSFESHTSGTSGVSDQDSAILEFDNNVPTLHDITPVPDSDIPSKEEVAQQLFELSLDMDDILVAEGLFI